MIQQRKYLSVKIIYLMAGLLWASHSIAATNMFHINQVSSTSQYYSVKITSAISSNNYAVEGISTQLPYLLARINQFITDNLSRDKTATITFGYSDGQDYNYWFSTGPCHIQLPDNRSVKVTLSRQGNTNPTCVVKTIP